MSQNQPSSPVPENNQTEALFDVESAVLPATLPILPLRGLVVYPLTAVPLNIGQPRSVRLIDDAVDGDRLIGLFASTDPEQTAPGPNEIFDVGVATAVHRLLRQPDGTIRLMVHGLHRVRIKEYIRTDPYLEARVEPWPETVETGSEIEAMAHQLAEMFLQLAEFVPSIPVPLLATTLNADNPLQLAYTVATYIRLDLDKSQEFLVRQSLRDKLEFLLAHIGRELEKIEVSRQIRSKAVSHIEQSQREFFLREQLKTIQRELGEEDERQVEIRLFQQKMAAANLPEEAKAEAERELNRLAKLPIAAAEYSVVRSYLEWLIGLPWNKTTLDNLDLYHARRVLDEAHHGLEEIKERIIEYLAVRRLRQQRSRYQSGENGRFSHSAILCLSGPPGVGKTSLGQSIAKAMDRKFARIALGGMRDEAEIRGHRRTYIGALPGRIIQALRQTDSKNPVIMLDEIDKLGNDFRGDPASALLELLDPEQNNAFRDHYLDVPFDLSDVLFIATANYLDPIPGPLRDRLEILPLAGYTEREKISIAQTHLLPRQLRENGLRPTEIKFSDGVMSQLILSYTQEAGVRELERTIGRICRKVATAVAHNLENGQLSPQTTQIAVPDLPTYLGPAKHQPETLNRAQPPGIATGLAWTSMGGTLIFVEATKMPGHKGLIITGQLGDVMKESVQAALSYIRSQATALGISPDFFNNHDLHIHVPAGAIPKDGPSAGITIAVALASLLTGRPVPSDLGMTGEITLRGQVMPIGGLKEKVLAAHRFGLKTVLFPQRNEPELVQIPSDILQQLTLVPADNMSQVLEVALDVKPVN